MASKADFTTEEWKLILEAPPSAGMIVVTAQRGGSFRETIAMAKSYVEARQQHGQSELLDEIVAERPRMERGKLHNHEELRDQGLDCLRGAVALLHDKATVEERDDYRRFVLTVANKVAAAHREGGQLVSPAEAQAIQDITTALGTAGSSAGQ